MRILMLDNRTERDHRAAKRLTEAGHRVDRIDDAKTCLETLQTEGAFDVVIMPSEIKGMTGLEFLDVIRGNGSSVPAVILSDSAGDERFAVEAMKRGAYDYVVQDEEEGYLRTLPNVIEEAYKRHELEEENIRLQRKLLESNQKLKELVIKDDLTGLYNRRYLFEVLPVEFERAQRYGFPLSCLMIDLDHFKKVNDTHGHPAGDFLLRGVAGVLRNVLRKIDIGFRYGGEEFLVILPNTASESTIPVARKIWNEIRSETWTFAGNVFGVTTSIGCFTYQRHNVQRAEEMIRFADLALYRAKDRGRDNVYIWNESTENVPEEEPRAQAG